MQQFNSVIRQRGYGIGGIFKGFRRTFTPIVKEVQDHETEGIENEGQVEDNNSLPIQWISFKPNKRRRIHPYIRRKEQ